MHTLTSHPIIGTLEMESGGHEPVSFNPTVRIKYKGSGDGAFSVDHTKKIVEMLHWLLDHEYVFCLQSPGIDCFNFFFKNEEEAIHFLLSHQ